MHFKNLVKFLLAFSFASTSLAQNTGGTVLGTSAPGLVVERNYLDKNPNAETNALYWTLFKDSGSRPVDGTGGTSDFTWTRSTSSPLSGKGSFLLTKPASNSQASGVAYDFTIDRQDRFSVLTLDLNAELVSGTYSNGTSSTDSDLIAYIYDVTNAKLIEPSAFKIQLGVAGQNVKIQPMEFQTTDSTSYRLMIFVATTSASAYTAKFDELKLGRNQPARGPPITDWQAYTPTVSNLGTGGLATNNAYYRRVGDSVEIEGVIIKDASAGSGTNPVNISLPPGLSADTAKLGSNSSRAIVGTAQHITSSFNSIITSSYYNAATVGITFGNNTTGNNFQGADLPVNRSIHYSALIPIVGWGSSLQTSDNADTRVVAFQASGIPTGTLSGAFNDVTFGATPTKDTHGGWNGSTSYTIRVPGTYRVSAGLTVNGTFALNQQIGIQVVKNGSAVNFNQHKAGGALNGAAIQVTSQFDAVVGDVIKVQSYCDATTPTYAGAAALHSFTLERISGPQQIAAVESVYAAAKLTGGFSNSNNTVQQISTGWSIDENSHGAMAATTAIFTAPVNGVYLVHLQAVYAANATGTRAPRIRKNGADVAYVEFPGNASVPTTATVHWTGRLTQGQTVEAASFQNSGGSLTLTADGNYTKFTVIKVGN